MNAFVRHYIETTSLIFKCSNDANLNEKVKFKWKVKFLKIQEKLEII